MMWLPNSRWTWSFALIAVAQAIIALAIEGYVFAQFEVNLRPNSRGTSASHSVPTYLALFIFGFLYQLVLVYDALRAKNTIQVIGLCLYNVGMVIYSGVQIAQVKEAIDGLTVSRKRTIYLPTGPSVEEKILRYPPNDRIIAVSRSEGGDEVYSSSSLKALQELGMEDF